MWWGLNTLRESVSTIHSNNCCVSASLGGCIGNKPKNIHSIIQELCAHITQELRVHIIQGMCAQYTGNMCTCLVNMVTVEVGQGG